MAGILVFGNQMLIVADGIILIAEIPAIVMADLSHVVMVSPMTVTAVHETIIEIVSTIPIILRIKIVLRKIAAARIQTVAIGIHAHLVTADRGNYADPSHL